jgi:hypothetical protein
MAIDFTKPIRLIKGDKAVVTVLFHDNRSVYYHVNESGYRNEVSAEVFETIFENVPVEPRKIKCWVGIQFGGTWGNRVNCSRIEGDLERQGYTQIKEVEFISGEGLK